MANQKALAGIQERSILNLRPQKGYMSYYILVKARKWAKDRMSMIAKESNMRRFEDGEKNSTAFGYETLKPPLIVVKADPRNSSVCSATFGSAKNKEYGLSADTPEGP